ncbi:hypothetical protein BGW42_005965 [Actinomortierella wolfii]|nr:hypothetical protein BGW42_005965 [Actinomortierella wolfii]
MSLTTMGSLTILPDTPTAWTFAGSLSSKGGADTKTSDDSLDMPAQHPLDKDTLPDLPSTTSISSIVSAGSAEDGLADAVGSSSTLNTCSEEIMDTLAFTELLTRSMTSNQSQSSSSSSSPPLCDSAWSSTITTTKPDASSTGASGTSSTTRTTRRMAVLQREKEQKNTMVEADTKSVGNFANHPVSRSAPSAPVQSSIGPDRYNKPLPKLPPPPTTTTTATTCSPPPTMNTTTATTVDTRTASATTPTTPMTMATTPSNSVTATPLPTPTPNAAAIYFPPTMSALHQKRRKLKRHAQRVPRPKNCFMLYRSKILPAIMAEWGGLVNNRILSKIAAERWKKGESEEVRRYYQQLAKQGNEEHRRIHPDYKYTAPPSSSLLSSSHDAEKKGKEWLGEDENEEEEDIDEKEGDHDYGEEEEEEQDNDEDNDGAVDCNRGDLDQDLYMQSILEADLINNEDSDVFVPVKVSSVRRVTTPASASVFAYITSTADGDFLGGVPLIAPLSVLGSKAIVTSPYTASPTTLTAAASSSAFSSMIPGPIPAPETMATDTTSFSYFSSLSPSSIYGLAQAPAVDHSGGLLTFDNSSATTLVDLHTDASLQPLWSTLSFGDMLDSNRSWNAAAALGHRGSSSGNGDCFLKPQRNDGHGIKMQDATTSTETKSEVMVPWPSFPATTMMMSAAANSNIHNSNSISNNQAHVKQPMKTMIPSTATDARWLQSSPQDPLQVLHNMYQLYNTDNAFSLLGHSMASEVFGSPSPPPLQQQQLQVMPSLLPAFTSTNTTSVEMDPLSAWLLPPHKAPGTLQQHSPMAQPFLTCHPNKSDDVDQVGLNTMATITAHNNNKNTATGTIDAFDAFMNFGADELVFEPAPVMTPAMPLHMTTSLSSVLGPPLPVPSSSSPAPLAASSSVSSSSNTLHDNIIQIPLSPGTTLPLQQRRGSVASTWTTLSTLSSVSSLSSLSSSTSSLSSIPSSSLSSSGPPSSTLAYLIPPPTAESLFQSFASMGRPDT